jgi:D-serine deaminase-like pyridoxal phosphate-dependent protein
MLTRVLDAIDDAAGAVELAGIEGYEGIAPGRTADERDVAAVDYLDSLAEAARSIVGRIQSDQPIISAGGSVYFDRVVDRLAGNALPEYQLILRSGGYVAHDDGYYQRSSPLSAGSDRLLDLGRLQAALVLWSVTLSRPAPDLAILGFGHRDAPSRLDLPIARWHGVGGTVTAVEPGTRIRQMDDQHAYLDTSGDLRPSIGDFVGCGISHPCEAFERWRVVLALDQDRRVVGLVPTFF